MFDNDALDAPWEMSRPPVRVAWLATAVAVAIAVVVTLILTSVSSGPVALLSDQARIVSPPVLPVAPGRAADVFRGLGAWASIYDALPAYQSGADPPPVGPQSVASMATDGVRVLFVQTAGTDSRSVGALSDPQLMGDFLTQAHLRGIRVVGWYLPTLDNTDADLQRLQAIAAFRAGVQRFDGIAVDMEDTTTVADPAIRNRHLVELSQRLRGAVGPNYPLGAIVIPPVVLDVINPALWPVFPWQDLAPYYNVWMPMSYWTFRSAASGYRDPARYTVENISLLRTDLANPAAPVHVIGGVSGVATVAEYRSFVEGAASGGALGASIFSYRFLSAADLAVLHAGVPANGFDQRGPSLKE